MMKIIRWDPFGGKNLLDEDIFNLPLNIKSVGFDLAADVYEKNNSIIVEMNIPGIDPDKIDITVEDQLLRISGKRDEEKEVKDKNYYSKEIRRGSFERVIELPSPVVVEKTTAEHKDGVLRVALPKKTPESAGKVKVAVGKR